MDRGKQQHLWINRKYHRIRADIPCELLPDGGPVSVRILNLSAGGLKFSCGHDVFIRILPESQRMPGRVTGVEAGIRFRLPSSQDSSASLRARIRVVYTERLAQDKYLVGVQFIDLDEKTARALQGCIDEYRGAPEP